MKTIICGPYLIVVAGRRIFSRHKVKKSNKKYKQSRHALILRHYQWYRRNTHRSLSREMNHSRSISDRSPGIRIKTIQTYVPLLYSENISTHSCDVVASRLATRFRSHSSTDPTGRTNFHKAGLSLSMVVS